LLVLGLGAGSPQFCVAALVIAAIASLIASLVQVRRAGWEITGLVLGIGAVLVGILVAMDASGCGGQLLLVLLGFLSLLLFAVTGLIALIALAVARRVEHPTGLFWTPLVALVSVTCASLVLGTLAGAYLHESVHQLARGPFSATSSMSHYRANHTATLLSDGRVLVTGGDDLWPLSSAELYNPKTGTFSATGTMTTARSAHSATLLPDGRVLIAGGCAGGCWDHNPVASAELYDPKTGTFGATGSMATDRTYHTATLLADGRVLIAGGCTDAFCNHTIASAELYDPKTGSFSPTGSMSTYRANHTATLLSDGRVLVTGGGDPSYQHSYSLSSAELYNPKTGTFSATGTMTTARSAHSATLLPDGRVLIAGGCAGGCWDHNPVASAELYDPKTGTFGATGSMSAARDSHAATLLSDGRVLVTGGGGLDSAERYDPTTGTFDAIGSMTRPRSDHTAALLPDGRVLIAGGNDPSACPLLNGKGAVLDSAELYQP
jgi:hypothetical protein